MLGISLPPTPAPTPTPPHGLQDLYRLMLDRTNQERVKAGVSPVRLGDNPAAQLHADAAFDGCYSSHWDRWGLKPNHRYSLAGGAGAGGENVSGSSYCYKTRDGYSTIQIRAAVAEAVSGWVSSPGHRLNLLNPVHTAVNVGIAYGRYNAVMVQQFSSDYVKYTSKPTISTEGQLTMNGTVNGATLNIGIFSNVQIAFDPPAQPLTKGQLALTYSSCLPQEIGLLLRPAPPGTRYTHTEGLTKVVTVQCVNPYETSPDRPVPASHWEARQDWGRARANAPVTMQVQVEYVIADRLDLTEGSFDASADLSPLLERYGPGIYTVRLWGQPAHLGERVSPSVLSEQAIFWETDPPAGNPYTGGAHPVGYRSDR